MLGCFTGEIRWETFLCPSPDEELICRYMFSAVPPLDGTLLGREKTHLEVGNVDRMMWHCSGHCVRAVEHAGDAAHSGGSCEPQREDEATHGR